jgi:hypothetical protein
MVERVLECRRLRETHSVRQQTVGVVLRPLHSGAPSFREDTDSNSRPPAKKPAVPFILSVALVYA